MKLSLQGLLSDPCSIKSAHWLSSYVPSQGLEWLVLIDVAAKCQVITAVILHLYAADSLWVRPPVVRVRDSPAIDLL